MSMLKTDTFDFQVDNDTYLEFNTEPTITRDLEEITINLTENGTFTYNPGIGKNGFSKITIVNNVQPKLQEYNASHTLLQEDSTVSITPDEGYQGFSSINYSMHVPLEDHVEYQTFNKYNYVSLDPQPFTYYPNQNYLGIKTFTLHPNISLTALQKTYDQYNETQRYDASNTPNDAIGFHRVTFIINVKSQNVEYTCNQIGDFEITPPETYTFMKKVTLHSQKNYTPILQNKTIDINTFQHTVEPDQGYDGLGRVVANLDTDQCFTNVYKPLQAQVTISNILSSLEMSTTMNTVSYTQRNYLIYPIQNGMTITTSNNRTLTYGINEVRINLGNADTYFQYKSGDYPFKSITGPNYYDSTAYQNRTQWANTPELLKNLTAEYIIVHRTALENILPVHVLDSTVFTQPMAILHTHNKRFYFITDPYHRYTKYDHTPFYSDNRGKFSLELNCMGVIFFYSLSSGFNKGRPWIVLAEHYSRSQTLTMTFEELRAFIHNQHGTLPPNDTYAYYHYLGINTNTSIYPNCTCTIMRRWDNGDIDSFRTTPVYVSEDSSRGHRIQCFAI